MQALAQAPADGGAAAALDAAAAQSGWIVAAGGSERLQREQDVAMMSCGFLFLCSAWIGPSTPLHRPRRARATAPTEACSLRVVKLGDGISLDVIGAGFSTTLRLGRTFTLVLSAGKSSPRGQAAAHASERLTRARANRPRCSSTRTASSTPKSPAQACAPKGLIRGADEYPTCPLTFP